MHTVCTEKYLSLAVVAGYTVQFSIVIILRTHTVGLKLTEVRETLCTSENYQCCGEPCFKGAAISTDARLPQISKPGIHKPFLAYFPYF
jgi:hypothetical protein